ncbi:unnamed protein product [Oikopleura dioica]|uniref:Uncharacterized protein n=1 Tax=Oikopleura dioica TaxID=34765 RepID=E4Z1D3_OIKDI|nr:unnamed protein product [Oikopleura dioica]
MENIEKRRRIEAESSLTELQVEYTNLVIQHELVKKALNNAERLLNEEDSEEFFSDLSYSDSEGASTQYERLRADYHRLQSEYDELQDAFQRYREDTEQDFALEQDQKERIEKLEEDLLCTKNLIKNFARDFMNFKIDAKMRNFTKKNLEKSPKI